MFVVRSFFSAFVLFSLVISTVGAETWGEKTFTEFHAPKWSYFNDPHIYAPLGAALLLALSDQDGELTDWASEKRPVFGSRESASSASDGLAFYVLGSQVIMSGLLTATGSQYSGWAKFKGVSASLLATVVSYFSNELMKDGSGRLRPDASDLRSFPSGHASIASSFSFLANENYKYANLNQVQREVIGFTTHTAAAAVSWARVEARRHHVSDVLVGYALGRLVTKLIYFTMIEPKENLHLGVQIDRTNRSLSLKYRF